MSSLRLALRLAGAVAGPADQAPKPGACAGVSVDEGPLEKDRLPRPEHGQAQRQAHSRSADDRNRYRATSGFRRDGRMNRIARRPRIFVTQPIAASALDRIKAVADISVNLDDSRAIPREALLAGVAECDFLAPLMHDKIDQSIIAA